MTRVVVPNRLLEAVSCGDISEVRRLIKDIRPEDVADDPLWFAAGQPEIARILIKWGCRPHTGLWCAGTTLDCELLRVLLEAGVDLRAKLVHSQATVVVAAHSGFFTTRDARTYLEFMTLVLCHARQTVQRDARTVYSVRGVVRKQPDLRQALGVGWRVYRRMKRTIEGAQMRVGVPPDWSALFRGTACDGFLVSHGSAGTPPDFAMP